MAVLAVAADLAALIQDTTYTTAALSQALTVASSEIRAYTGQQFDATSDVVVVSPQSGGVVFLPQIPVQSVTQVEIFIPDPVTGIQGWAMVDPSYYRSNSHGTVYLTQWLPTWPNGWDTVRVTYSHGYSTIPDELRDLCLSLAARWLDNPYQDSATRAGAVSTDYISRSSKDLTLRDHEKATLSRFTLHEVA